MMGTNPSISVIIPFYNAASYLRRCLDSVVVQTFVNFEVILVDDGSTDSSLKICEEYVNKDKRFYIIKRQVNGGISVARNSGMDVARGRYLCFIDSDDYVVSNYLQNLWICVDLNPCCEIVMQGYVRAAKKKCFVPIVDKTAYFNLPDESGELFHFFRIGDFSHAWAKLFSKKIIDENRLYFNSSFVKFEDMDFVLRFMLYVRCVCIDFHCNYLYVSNSGSLSSFCLSFFREEAHFKRLLSDWHELMHKYKGEALCASYAFFYGGYINQLFFSAVMHPEYKSVRLQNLQIIKEQYIKQYTKLYKPQSVYMSVVKMCIVYNCVWLYVLLMRFVHSVYHIRIVFI